MRDIKAIRDFFDEKVNQEHINVEFHSADNNFNCLIFKENGDIYKGQSNSNIYEAFYEAYSLAFGNQNN